MLKSQSWPITRHVSLECPYCSDLSRADDGYPDDPDMHQYWLDSHPDGHFIVRDGKHFVFENGAGT